MYLSLKAILKSAIKKEARNMKIATIKSGLKSLKMDIKNMSKDEIKNRKLDLLLLFIEDIVNKLEKNNKEENHKKI